MFVDGECKSGGESNVYPKYSPPLPTHRNPTPAVELSFEPIPFRVVFQIKINVFEHVCDYTLENFSIAIIVPSDLPISEPAIVTKRSAVAVNDAGYICVRTVRRLISNII